MNIQVPLMGKLFAQASSVIVWLGETNPDVELAVAWSRSVDEAVQTVISSNLRLSHLLERYQFLRGFDDIFSRIYWRRMWTFQEYHLAKQEPILLCGHLSFFASDVLSVNDTIVSLIPPPTDLNNNTHPPMEYDKDPSLLDQILAIQPDQLESSRIGFTVYELRRMVTNPIHHLPQNERLFPLLIRTCDRNCQDPRDNVYALYGVDPAIQDIYPLDYAKPRKQIMLETTEYVTRRFPHALGELLAFYCLHPDRLSDPTFPSWTPDFGHNVLYSSHPDNSHDKTQYVPRPGFAKAIGEGTSLVISPDLRTLELQGRCIGACQWEAIFAENNSMVRVTMDIFTYVGMLCRSEGSEAWDNPGPTAVEKRRRFFEGVDGA
jgi:hypothetical protein